MLARQISYGGAFSTGRVPVCDRRTDKGRMDGHTTTAYTALAYSVAQQKFNDSSFSYSIDIVGANQNLNGIRDRTTPLSGIVCHPWTNSCYSQFTLSQKNDSFRLLYLRPTSTDFYNFWQKCFCTTRQNTQTRK